MNMIGISGRLTRSPELRTTEKGMQIARFTVAVDFKKNGEKSCDFFDCVAFGKTADVISRYFNKGDGIGVTGEIHCNKFTGKDGKESRHWEVTVKTFDFFHQIKAFDEETTKTALTKETTETGDFDADMDDDFPF